MNSRHCSNRLSNFHRPRCLFQIREVGRERLVLDLSCRRKSSNTYYVVTDRWQRFSDLAVTPGTLRELAGSCAEFLVHGVDVEGKQLGIDGDLVALLGNASPLPVTYAGGVRSMVCSARMCSVDY